MPKALIVCPSYSGGSKEPFFFQTEHRENGMTWLIVATVALLVILAGTPLLHGAYACRTGPFAKD